MNIFSYAKIALVLLFLLIQSCSSPVESQDQDTDITENQLDPAWSGYPIHRGYNVSINLAAQDEVYYLGINFHADSYHRILNLAHRNEYDLILEFRSWDTTQVLIHSGDNRESEIFIYTDIQDFMDIHVLPDPEQKTENVSAATDGGHYLLIRNRHGYYAKFLIEKPVWKYAPSNARYTVSFVFEFYYYLQSNPDLTLH